MNQFQVYLKNFKFNELMHFIIKFGNDIKIQILFIFFFKFNSDI